MYYFIVRKSDSTFYCAAFTSTGFTTEWMDSTFYNSAEAAQTVANNLSYHFNEEFEVEKC